MSTPAAPLKAHIEDGCSHICITGRVNFHSAMDFKALIASHADKGCKVFRLDLTNCALMDSTFLGVLAGLALNMCGTNGGAPVGRVELINPNERMSELLENLGVIHLFTIRSDPKLAQSSKDKACDTTDASKQEITEACLEAHKTLIDINPENEARFRDVTQFLEEDLKRLKKQKPED